MLSDQINYSLRTLLASFFSNFVIHWDTERSGRLLRRWVDLQVETSDELPQPNAQSPHHGRRLSPLVLPWG